MHDVVCLSCVLVSFVIDISAGHFSLSLCLAWILLELGRRFLRLVNKSFGFKKSDPPLNCFFFFSAFSSEMFG